MELVNLTPHPIVVYTEDGVRAVLEPSGVVARMDTVPKATVDQEFEGVGTVPVVALTYDTVKGLPNPAPGRYYIVSAVVADQVKRPDLLVPHPLVRDDNGNVIGCRGFRTPTK